MLDQLGGTAPVTWLPERSLYRSSACQLSEWWKWDAAGGEMILDHGLVTTLTFRLAEYIPLKAITWLMPLSAALAAKMMNCVVSCPHCNKLNSGLWGQVSAERSQQQQALSLARSCAVPWQRHFQARTYR
jgi:hypothetical protein